MLQLIDWLSRV